MKRVSLTVAIICACCATIAAAWHAGPAVIGWSLAVAALGVAAAAAATARDLGAPDDLREPRQVREPTPQVPLPADMRDRRGAFGRWWFVAAGAFAAFGVVPLLALARRQAPRGTAWTGGARLVTPEGVAVRADTLLVGGVVTVFPAGHIGAPAAATMLIRLPSDVLRGPPGRAGWAPSGNVAYSKICTHAGCPVAIYRQQSYQLYCPCHQSVFDVLDAARPISGPATRALPQLALDVDAQGYLVARGDYTEPVGPDSWWRTI